MVDPEDKSVKKTGLPADPNVKDIDTTAAKVVSKVNDKQGMEVNDEVCNNEQYEAAKASQNEISICSIDIYPTSYKDLGTLEQRLRSTLIREQI